MSDMRNNRQGKNSSGKAQVVLCPKCHKEHFSAYALIDEYINCDCGFSFYAFADRGLRIMMTPEEAGFEPIARAMRRFVVATGRCRDIDPRLLEDTEQIPKVEMQERNLDEEVAQLLEEYQLAAFGECYITRELIDSICKAFGHDADVVLKKQKDGIDISEMKKPKRVSKTAAQNARILTYGAKFGAIQGRSQMPAGGGIMRSCQGTEARMIGQ